MSDEENFELVRRFNRTPGAEDLSVLVEDWVVVEDIPADGQEPQR